MLDVTNKHRQLHLIILLKQTLCQFQALMNPGGLLTYQPNSWAAKQSFQLKWQKNLISESVLRHSAYMTKPAPLRLPRAKNERLGIFRISRLRNLFFNSFNAKHL